MFKFKPVMSHESRNIPRVGSSTNDVDRGASKTNQARYSIRRDVQKTENRGHRGVSGQLGDLAYNSSSLYSV